MTELADFAARLTALTDGRASAPRIRDGVMTLSLDVGGLGPDQRDGLAAAIREGGMTVPGVSDVRIAMTAERRPLRILAVASGKGGVGKSTVSTNLAVAFAQMGLRVGLLDADVYGPSAPKMMGVDGDPLFENEKLQPLEAHGVKLMSIGFIVDEGKAMIWRGPMASSAVRQMIHDVAWGSEKEPLDVLVVDLPPGTGDIQLTLVQKLRIDGVVLVTTPQEIALIDARRAAVMFEKTATPILGLIENMAFFADPSTGAPIPIFGEGGGVAEAERLKVPLLGRVPIEMGVRIGGDEGSPAVVSEPKGQAAQVFVAAAKALWKAVG